MVATLSVFLLAVAWSVDHASSWKHPDNEANGWTGLCRNGTEQSPIDIQYGDKGAVTAVNFEPLVFVNYDNLVNYNLTNNGHTAVLTAQANSCNVYITGGGLRKLFKLVQMHFHWGSEHLINGYRYPLEVHLVHYDSNYESLQDALGKNNSLAVIAVLFRQDKSDMPNLELSQVVAGLRAIGEPDRHTPLSARFSPGMLLPTDTERWWRYAGSLTTPSCDQGVIWTVFKDTLPVARDQVKEFQKLTQHGDAGDEFILKNFRAPQPLKHRTLFYQDPGQHAKCGAGRAASASTIALSLVSTVFLMAALHQGQVNIHGSSPAQN